MSEPKLNSSRSWAWVGAAAVLVIMTGLLVYRIAQLRQPEQPPPQPKAELVLPAQPEPAAKPTRAAELPAPPAIPTQPPAGTRQRIPTKQPVPVRVPPSSPPASEPPPAPAATPTPAPEPAPAEAELPPQPKMRRRTEILQPDPEEVTSPPRPRAESRPSVEAAPAAEPPAPYSGPSAGTLIWSGQIEKDTLITITGDRASIGRITGELPGVPVNIDFEDKGAFAIVERPSPANNWKKLSLRTLKRIRGGQVIKWTALPGAR